MYRRPGEGRDIVHRWEGNPLIRLQDLSFACADVWSAGVASFQGSPVLLVTIEHMAGHQSIHLAHSDNEDGFVVEEEPFIDACRDDSGCSRHESRGVSDAKVTFMDGVYHIMYLANGDYGYRLGLATTKDFKSIESRNLISEPDTKAGALFPEKIDGRYVRLERPKAGNSIWISYSDDLIYWGGSKLVMGPRGGYWDSGRVGVGVPPIRIDAGWLLIYYGVKLTSAGPLFRLGAAVLDHEDPTKLIGRSNIPILSPRELYERVGDLSNIVFTSGAFVTGKEDLQIFYSGASSCVCFGTTTIPEILDMCQKSEGDF